MEITFKKCFTDTGMRTPLVPSPEKACIKNTFIELLKSKNEYDQNDVQWKDDEHVEVSNISSMTLHSFLLRAEEMGKRVQLEKKMVIKIID